MGVQAPWTQLSSRPMRRRLRSAAFPLHRHSIPQLAIDGALVAAAYYLSYRLRFDTGTPKRYEDLFDSTIVFVVVSALIVFTLFRLELKQWRYTSSRDYLGIFQAVVVNTLVLAGFIAVTHPVTVRSGAGDITISAPTGSSRSSSCSRWCWSAARASSRASSTRARCAASARAPTPAACSSSAPARAAGSSCARSCATRSSASTPSASSTTTAQARHPGRRRQGAGTDRPARAHPRRGRARRDHHRDPVGAGHLRARVVRAARQRGIPVRTLPTVFELLQAGSGQVVRQVREVRVEDILGREPVRMELDRVGGYLGGEVVMITGAGGSIGAELCRQIARVAPRRLVLVDHAEENLFRIQRELEDDRHVHPSTLAPVLADCKEGERMREVFAEHRPTVVFHAAAYKHVGLMERNPVEAVRNNALATRLVARVAGEARAKRFVLVSTDKAVQPATVMGASKALAEFAVEAAQQRWPETKFATVRFGNVLGSSGSVVPIFRRQIALGGPVTVTDERMTRYFMTIPEAVQLVIRAGSLGEGGELFVLQMGEPVSIMQLARDMIELSGLAPGATSPSRSWAPARREAARGPVQPLRASQAHPRRQDHPRAPRCARSGRRRGDLRRDRSARARGRCGRSRGQGRRALGRPPGGSGDG
jgi:FlaA1/EpsC-like NDP-sugar epimerase